MWEHKNHKHGPLGAELALRKHGLYKMEQQMGEIDLHTLNLFKWPQFAKYSSRQYFPLYSISKIIIYKIINIIADTSKS